MATIGPRKKIDIEVTEEGLAWLRRAMEFVDHDRDYADEVHDEKPSKDLKGND